MKKSNDCTFHIVAKFSRGHPPSAWNSAGKKKDSTKKNLEGVDIKKKKEED